MAMLAMINKKEDFDLLNLIEHVKTLKYEKTVVGFAVLDKLDKMQIPRKLKSRKPAVQAMYAITNNLIKYAYFTQEEKEKLDMEAAKSDAPYKKFTGLFNDTSAPQIEEDTEEEFIPEEEAKAPNYEIEDEESGYKEEYIDDRLEQPSVNEESDNDEDEDEDESEDED